MIRPPPRSTLFPSPPPFRSTQSPPTEPSAAGADGGRATPSVASSTATTTRARRARWQRLANDMGRGTLAARTPRPRRPAQLHYARLGPRLIGGGADAVGRGGAAAGADEPPARPVGPGRDSPSDLPLSRP